jgi:hypothetical protein
VAGILETRLQALFPILDNLCPNTCPWICTWYLCPVQTAILRKRDSLQYDAFNRIVREIKALREALEEEFIRVVT